MEALYTAVSKWASKYGTLYSKWVTLQFMNVGSWACVRCLRYTVLMSLNKDETAVHCCDSASSVLVMFGVPLHSLYRIAQLA